MIGTILKRVLGVVKKKPLKLFGVLLLGALLNVIAFAGFGSIYGVFFCISLLLDVGITMVFLHGYRGEDVESVQLFDAFKGGWPTVKRVLIGMSWTKLWIFLWGLIPVVGWFFALLRTYEYRLVPYILVQEPDVEPLEAMKISKERTKGYVWKMLLTDLIIAGAVAAVVLTLTLFASIFLWTRLYALYGFFNFINALIFTALAVVAYLATGLVQAAYYEEITNPTPEAPAAPVAPVTPVVPVTPIEVAPAPVETAPVAPVEVAPVAPVEVAPVAPVAPVEVAPVVEEAPAAPVEVAPVEVAPVETAPVVEEAPAAPVEAPKTVIAFCPNCGTKLTEDAVFCPNCGNKVR